MGQLFHKDYQDPDRHEPKGIDGKPFGSLYFASGSTGGFWTGIQGLTGLNISSGGTGSGAQGVTGMQGATGIGVDPYLKRYVFMLSSG
jgi:hypothetical protein